MNKKIEEKKTNKNTKTETLKTEKTSEKVSTFKKKKKLKEILLLVRHMFIPLLIIQLFQ
tara:strand:- start:222 stop:398 length:177 start_codon:yes stop_codon:yes gene_type:complete